jgi:hypothetical protein
MDLPSIFQVDEINNPLMTFLLQIIKNCNELSRISKDAKQTLNILKWALRIINKYLFKYLHPQKTSDSFFSTDWVHNHAYTLWDSLVRIIKNYRTTPLEPNIMALIQKTIFNLLDYEAIVEAKLENAEDTELKQFFQGIISCLYLTQSEQRYFEENPGDFIKNNDETVQHEVSLFRYYTIKILKRVTQSEKFQVIFLTCCSSILFESQTMKQDDSQTSFIKEMVYSSFQITSNWLLSSQYTDSLKDLVNLFICADLETNLMAFLLVRILLFITSITPEGINNEQADKIFLLINKHLKSQECTTKLAALILVQRLLEFPSIRSQFNRTDAELLVDVVLETILQTENEILIVTLKQILDQFHGVIDQVYSRTVEKLSQIFFKLTDHISSLAVDDSDSRELEEKSDVCLAARNCLMLLEDIVKEKLPQDHLRECSNLVLAVLKRCYERHEDDLLTDGRKTLSGIYLLNALVSRNQLSEEESEAFCSLMLYNILERPLTSVQTSESRFYNSLFQETIQNLPSPNEVSLFYLDL